MRSNFNAVFNYGFIAVFYDVVKQDIKNGHNKRIIIQFALCTILYIEYVSFHSMNVEFKKLNYFIRILNYNVCIISRKCVHHPNNYSV